MAPAAVHDDPGQDGVWVGDEDRFNITDVQNRLVGSLEVSSEVLRPPAQEQLSVIPSFQKKLQVE